MRVREQALLKAQSERTVITGQLSALEAELRGLDELLESAGADLALQGVGRARILRLLAARQGLLARQAEADARVEAARQGLVAAFHAVESLSAQCGASSQGSSHS
jgi:hypothetical protein